jgi:RimJ/RimL family protein N-acetyltransferase
MASDIDEEDDDIPTLIQLYVEPEFRQRGYASEALKLLLRDHQSLRVDDPSAPVIRLIQRCGFEAAGAHGDNSRALTMFVRTAVFEDQ